MASDVFGTGEVARICQVSAAMVRKWMDRGLLIGWRTPGGQHRRVYRPALERFMRGYGLPLDRLPPAKEE